MPSILDIGQIIAMISLAAMLWNTSRSTKKDNTARIEQEYEYRKRTDKALAKTDVLDSNYSDMKSLFYDIKDTINDIKYDVSELRILRENVIGFEILKAECVGELMELHKNDNDKMKDLYNQFTESKRNVYTVNSQLKK